MEGSTEFHALPYGWEANFGGGGGFGDLLGSTPVGRPSSVSVSGGTAVEEYNEMMAGKDREKKAKEEAK